MKLTIRQPTLDDAATIADFNCRLCAETEDTRLDPDVCLRGTQRAIEEDRGVTYFVAEVDGRVVGQLMFFREWSDWRDGEMWWLGSVYVHPEFRGRGVFRSLVEHVSAMAEADADVRLIRLYVETENEAARATYGRLGFKELPYRVYERPT